MLFIKSKSWRFSIGNLVKILVIAVALMPIGAFADLIDVKLSNGIVAKAEFRKGVSKFPAVIVLHGFLQTHYNLTVQSLTHAIAELGFTVLAPTLSLGLNQRKQSLACEAIHTHTMQGDFEEIGFWIKWLNQKNYQKIVLVGHSYGSLQLIAYAASHTIPTITKIVATSLVDIDNLLSAHNSTRQLKLLKQQVAKDGDTLGHYSISYCKKYVAPARSFLSYAKWSKSAVLDSLPKISVSVEVVLGSDDNRMGQDWPKQIREKGAKVFVIKGANHFFSAEFEFDLTDYIEQSLKLLVAGN